MAKESIRKIREAEATAAEIIAEAERSAADMITIAEKRGKDHLEKVTLDCEAENRAKLTEIHARTDEMVQNGRAEAAEAAGLIPVNLGPRILRCETAPMYALSAISYRLEL